MHRLRYLLGVAILAATAIGVVFLLQLLRSGDDSGLLVRVEFADARGLRGGADVRYRGVNVGTVRAVTISGDGSRAVAELRLDDAGAAHARIDSQFWIVTPRFAGITSGATGLDTLVRDAYLAFTNPAGIATPLHAGSLLRGRERPPAGGEPEGLEPIEHGDLLMGLLVPENHGLRPGSPVVFRGTTVGEVRSVELAEDGSFVETQLRIGRAHRRTVTDRCEFWVARPQLSGALLSGFTVTDVSALLSPHVVYHGEAGRGVPVEDGFRAAALASRPDVRVAEVPAAALRRPARAEPPASDPIVLVHVIYAAIERDTFSPDDPVRHEGNGLLLLDSSDRPVVLTARSLVDGSYTETDAFGGDPDIDDEQIKVVLPGGSVQRAGRVWVHPGGLDLAVLVLENTPPDLVTTPMVRLSFDAEPAPDLAVVSWHRAAADGSRQPALPGTATLPAPPLHLGAVAVVGERVVGILGRSKQHAADGRLLPLGLLPMDLRPVDQRPVKR